MLRAVMAAVVALGVVGAGCRRPAAGVAAPAVGPDSIGDILRFVESWRTAYEARDGVAMGAFYAPGDPVVRVHQGRAAHGFAAVDAQLRIVAGKATAIHVRLADIRVAALATGAALVTAAMTREVSDGVTTVTESGVLTLALRAGDGGWLIVGEHYSYAPP
jgi:ketosteroid isomerase-like protein